MKLDAFDMLALASLRLYGIGAQRDYLAQGDYRHRPGSDHSPDRLSVRPYIPTPSDRQLESDGVEFGWIDLGGG